MPDYEEFRRDLDSLTAAERDGVIVCLWVVNPVLVAIAMAGVRMAPDA